MTFSRPLPLADLRVVAVEQYGAGPFGSLQLADLGAEVIKIEDPTIGGDVSRSIPPYADGEGNSLFFESFNRNKKSVAIDLRQPHDRAAFEDLVRVSDAVFCNLRGDTAARLGLDYEALKIINPRIVCCSLSGFGSTGPRSSEGAYDYVIQGLAGWMSLTGAPDDPPTKSGLSLVDLAGGYVAALALLSAVWAARRDGVGRNCDLSLYETALALLTYVGTWVASRGYVPRRHPNSAHPSLIPFQLFPTADGWLVIACAKEKFWQRLVHVIGRPELGDDPRFCTFVAREANRVDITTELEHAFVKRKTDEWLVDLRAAGIPAGAINDVAAALEDPQAQAREVISEFTHPHLGTVRQLKSPLRLDDGRAAIERGPFLGEHTAQLLSELCDYDTSMLDQLAIRSHAPDRTTNAPALTSPDKCELVNRASSSSCPRERQ
jgi:crotonobetainyl-CoA:carnitine CoA-transferase CaiB-like acyl-CoA transferase